ncbi:MAG: hypothetical protein AB1894_27820 [Chloroflexota bacterium]
MNASTLSTHRKKKSLLELALVHEKPHWLARERIIIWRDPRDATRRAYLQENGGTVSLYVSTHPATCVIFKEDPLTAFWDISETLASDYPALAARVKRELRSVQHAHEARNHAL